MDYPINADQLDLEDLVRRAKAGEDVVLTQNGQPVVRLQPVGTDVAELGWDQMAPEERLSKLEALVGGFRNTPNDGISAARSQDFLYGWDGLPR